MCGLCGIFGTDDHWATKKGGRASADPRLRRMDRQARLQAVNALLRNRRLKVSDWQADTFVVSSPTGKIEIVSHLAEIWTVVEDRFGGVFDPLSDGDTQ